MRSIALFAAFLVLGCPKEEAKKAPTTEAPPAVKSVPAEEKEPAPPAKAAAKNDTPPWKKEAKGTTKCAAPTGSKEKLQTLAKGEGDAIDKGEFDLELLTKDVAGDCTVARHHLADALNAGGFQHYKKKDYDKANNWWRAALVVHPGHALARFNLACGLALAGKREQAVWNIGELARAADDGDAAAANLLEKAKSDDDLKSIREDAAFKKAIAVSQAGLVGPRKEPETAKEAVKLLPEEFRKVKDHLGVSKTGFITYKPMVLDFWTWRPVEGVELLVATVIDDPANLGQPKGDLNQDYGGLMVLRRNKGKLELLHARKTGESPPSVAAGKGNTVFYSFAMPCSDLRGTISYKDGKVKVDEQRCEDL